MRVPWSRGAHERHDLEREIARGTLGLTPFVVIALVFAVLAAIVLAVSGILWAVLVLV